MADKFQGADRNQDVSDFPLERVAGASADQEFSRPQGAKDARPACDLRPLVGVQLAYGPSIGGAGNAQARDILNRCDILQSLKKSKTAASALASALASSGCRAISSSAHSAWCSCSISASLAFKICSASVLRITSTRDIRQLDKTCGSTKVMIVVRLDRACRYSRRSDSFDES
jgi:hypothetical protein